MNCKNKMLLGLLAVTLVSCGSNANGTSSNSNTSSSSTKVSSSSTISSSVSSTTISSSSTSLDVSDEHNYSLKSTDNGVYTYSCSHCDKEFYVSYISGTENIFTLESNVLTFANLTESSSYSLSGDFYGNIVIDAGDDYELELELNGFNLISSNDAAISITSGDKITLSSKKSTSNYVYDLRESENSTAAIYSLSDLAIQGKGSLEVTSNGKGIHTKDDLKVKNVALKINAYDDALRGNDSVKIESGDLELVSRVGDGIKTSNSDVSSKGNQRGIVTLSGGNIDVYAACDGIDAAYNVVIDGEVNLNVYTDKYSSYSEEVTDTKDSVYYVRSSNTNYKYSIKYSNDENEVYYNSSTYETVQSFRNTYYYYPITKPEGYSKMTLYVYNSSQEQGQNTDYYFASDSMTLNSNYDTISYSNNRVSWTNKDTAQPGGMGGPGGMDEGNTDKGDHSTKGIKAANEIYISNGSINIKSYDDSIHANNDTTLENGEAALGNINITGGNLELYSNDDAIHADNKVSIEEGVINITNSYEGIEGAFVEIKGGTISVISSDDGINGVSTSGEAIVISGGELYIYAGGDGVDSNSTSSYDGILFSGGKAVIISYGRSDSSIDTERGYKYTGGNIVGISISGGMSSESMESSPSFSTIGTNSNINLQANSILVIKNIVEIKMPSSINASVVYLGNNSASISSTSSTTSSLNANGVYWNI